MNAMKQFFLLCISLWHWLFFFLTCLTLLPLTVVVWLLTMGIDRRKYLLHVITSFWGWSLIRCNPLLTVKILDRDKIKPGKAYVIICNHQSVLDISVVFMLFVHFKWVAKIEMFRTPIVGWVLRMNQYVPIHRGDKDSAQQMAIACQKHLQRGSSVTMFPEGTRSEDGNLRPFKEGAFRLALQAKVPLLPVVLDGTAQALPKHCVLLRRSQTILVRVLDEIPYESFSGNTPGELADRARNLMQQALRELRERKQ